MSINHVLTHLTKIDNGAGRVENLTFADSEIGEYYITLDRFIDESDLYETEININISDIKAFMCWISTTNPAGTLELKTNSSTVPDDTIVLIPGAPVIWTPKIKLANVFSVDVTTGLFFKADSGGSQLTHLQMRLLMTTTQP